MHRLRMPCRARLLAWYFGLAVCCTGCLPSSCQRTPSRAISTADSLSRQIAAGLVPDTLAKLAALSGNAHHQLEYPRTVLFGDHGDILVSDARRNSVFRFDAAGTFVREVTWEQASIPYLAGRFGDTTVVFSPGTRRVDYVARGTVVHSIATPADLAETALQYVTATRHGILMKVTGKNVLPRLIRLGRDGSALEQRFLKGSTWRQSGPLRTWGDTLLSLSGFFPVVDAFDLSLKGAADSLVLQGFDSPMLARTFSFTQGSGRGAPLLLSSAAAAGPYLFVLNLRPGWLRIDVYNRRGVLQHVLVEPEPGYNREFYAIDLAIRRQAEAKYRVAVAIVKPEPVVELFAWAPTADLSHSYVPTSGL